jgi:two-component system phosphate regulon response regulator PhoB
MDQKKILIADDEPSLRLLVSSTLEDERFEIIQAVDGTDALEKAQKHQPDLIILDLMMPNMSGIEVCRTIKSAPTLHIPQIIVLTAKGQEQDIKEAAKAGADRYLKKPFSPLELLTAVEEALASGTTAK